MMLADFCPTYVPLSKLLDLSNDIDNAWAYAYFEKLTKHCETIAYSDRDATRATIKIMQLNIPGNYHVKSINDEIFSKGFGYFTDSEDDIMPGMYHMMRCLNAIYRCESSRAFAEYPIALRSRDSCHYDSSTSVADGASYFDLTTIGYRIGTPSRSSEEYTLFYNKFAEAVAAIKQAGVVHLDLYPSNILWKIDYGVADVKIIDWDVSRLLSGKAFNPRIEAAILERFGHKTPIEDHDALYLSVYESSYVSCPIQWDHISSGDKCRIDEAFTAMLTENIRARDLI